MRTKCKDCFWDDSCSHQLSHKEDKCKDKQTIKELISKGLLPKGYKQC